MGTALAIKGTQNFMGITIPIIYGGFGESKKSVTVNSVSEIHDVEPKTINRYINRLIEKNRMKEFIDYINMLGSKEFESIANNLGLITSNVQKYCYILSERGYSKLVKYMDDDKSWEVHDRLVDEYFALREEKENGTLPQPKTPSDPLDREEIAALMLCVKEGNDLLLTGQLNVMTAMKDMFTDFIKAQAEFNNNVMNTINTLAQTMVTSQKALPVKEETTYVVPKTEIAWKSDVFKKVNKYAKDNSSAPQSVLGKIYKRMKNKGINLDSYMDKYREETGLYNNTVINVIAHYDELRTEFDKELGALCNGENQEIPMSISAEAMKTPKAISSLVEQLKPKFGKTNSVVMRRVYKRFEEKTGTSLNIQCSLLAKNLGISNCSKAYAIYSDEKLMNTLMQVIKEMYEEV